MAHFDDCGAHCSHQYCKQRDFLPITCKACKKNFCRDHFRAEQHDCIEAGAADRRVLVCPLCSKSVPLVHGESADDTFAQHERSGDCQPCSMAAPASKNRCPVKGCREKLTFINTYECPKCKQRVCMSHRFEEVHNCAAKQGEKGSRSVAGAKPSAVAQACSSSSRTCAAAAAAAEKRMKPGSFQTILRRLRS